MTSPETGHLRTARAWVMARLAGLAPANRTEGAASRAGGAWLRTRAQGGSKHKEPLYPKLLRLQHVHPNAWQRAVLGEGMALVGALLALADVASAWTILVLPVAVAGVVKAHDLLAGFLRAP